MWGSSGYEKIFLIPLVTFISASGAAFHATQNNSAPLSAGKAKGYVLWPPSFPHLALWVCSQFQSLSSGQPGLTQSRALSWLGDWPGRPHSKCDVNSSEVREPSPSVLNRPSLGVSVMPAILGMQGSPFTLFHMPPSPLGIVESPRAPGPWTC